MSSESFQQGAAQMKQSHVRAAAVVVRGHQDELSHGCIPPIVSTLLHPNSNQQLPTWRIIDTVQAIASRGCSGRGDPDVRGCPERNRSRGKWLHQGKAAINGIIPRASHDAAKTRTPGKRPAAFSNVRTSPAELVYSA